MGLTMLSLLAWEVSIYIIICMSNERFSENNQSLERSASPQNWKQVLDSYPDHERHLETEGGRFQAILNIAKNGGMAIEIMVMDREWRSYHLVNGRARKSVGGIVNNNSVTLAHLVKTISTVGAAARSDIDEHDWQLTPFGESIKPALIYTWQKIIEHDINPVGALGSRSDIRKDREGNIIITPPLVRARMLIAINTQEYLTENALATKVGVDSSATLRHLQNLRAAGLISYESVDTIDSYNFFSLTEQGKLQREWPVYVNSQDINQPRLSRNIRETIISLTQQRNTFTITDIIDYATSNAGSASNQGNHGKVLNFWVSQGLLDKSDLSGKQMSKAAITDKGSVFIQQILLPLLTYSRDAQSVAEINTIRENLQRDPNYYQQIYPQIVRVYSMTSPNKNRSLDIKTFDIINAISQNPGKLTASEIARRLGISIQYVNQLTQRLVESAIITAQVGKGGRKYFSISERQKET